MIDKTVPSTVVAQFQGIVCNMATELIWKAYDFRETIADLPPFYLVPNEQDILPAMSAIPADFLGFRKVQLCQYSSGCISKQDMTVVKDIQLTHVRGLPRDVNYNASTRAFRVFPRTPDNIGSPFWFIEGSYKKRPVAITNAQLDTVFPFDDLYLPVYIEVFRWAFYALAGMDKADNQYAKALAFIESMASNEGLNEGDAFIAPAASLVGSYSGFPNSGYYGIFG
jgi:hypothetical protein